MQRTAFDPNVHKIFDSSADKNYQTCRDSRNLPYNDSYSLTTGAISYFLIAFACFSSLVGFCKLLPHNNLINVRDVP